MGSSNNDIIHKNDLDQFKLELLSKINSRFLDEDDKEKTELANKLPDDMITPEKFDDDSTSMVFDSTNKDPLE